MVQISVTPRVGEQAADKNGIRPFRASVPDADLAELRRRIEATKWPERETVTDATQVSSSQQCRRSRAIGRQSTTGAR